MALVSIFAMLAGAIVLVSRAQQDRTPAAPDPELVALRAEIDRIDRALEELPALWERAADRAEAANETAKKRLASARAAESRARRAQADDGGEDDLEEDPQLQLVHAGGGAGEGLYPVRADVERDPQDDLTQRAIAAGWTPFI